jgi:hypothetical protein
MTKQIFTPGQLVQLSHREGKWWYPAYLAEFWEGSTLSGLLGRGLPLPHRKLLMQSQDIAMVLPLPEGAEHMPLGGYIKILLNEQCCYICPANVEVYNG